MRASRVARALVGEGDPAHYLLTTRYIDSLKEMTRGNNSKVIFMPVETSQMLSAVGAIRELIGETGEKRADANEQQRTRQNPPPRQLPT